MSDSEELYEQALSAMRHYSGESMGYRPVHQKHKKGKPCYDCIRELEIECGLALPPKPPSGPGGGSMIMTPNEIRSLPPFNPDYDLLEEIRNRT